MFSPGYGEWFAAPLPAAPSAHYLSTRFRALALFGRRSSERKNGRDNARRRKRSALEDDRTSNAGP
jgi:hypothetical protein